MSQAQIQFAKWLQKNEPFLFNVAVKVAEKQQGQGLGFIANIDWGAIGKAAMTTVKEIAPAAIQLQAQKKALDANLKRAQQGQPPIDFNQYTPAIKVAAEITPDSEAAINRTANVVIDSISRKAANAAPWIVGGLVAVFVLPKLIKR